MREPCKADEPTAYRAAGPTITTNTTAVQMPDDGALFRYWCEEASYRPSRVAVALTKCTTPEEYRAALHGLMMADRR